MGPEDIVRAVDKVIDELKGDLKTFHTLLYNLEVRLTELEARVRGIEAWQNGHDMVRT